MHQRDLAAPALDVHGVQRSIRGEYRILILHLSVGSGHRVAAEAIEAALSRLAPQADVGCVDLVRSGDSRVLRRLPQLYSATLRLAPWLYDWFWRRTGPRWMRWFGDQSGSRRTRKSLGELVAQAQPDAIVCTHSMAARVAAALRQEGMQFRHIAVFTDFGCNHYWPTEGVDHYVVPAAEVATELGSRGVPSQRLHVCGIPVRPSLWDGTLHVSGFPTGPRNGRATVLAMAGSTQRGLYRAAAESARRLVAAHACDSSAYDLTVVTGRDADLRRQLQPIAVPEHCQVLGYVHDMPGLLRRADVLVTKAGGLATAEALAAGVPLIYVGGCAGQERANVEHVVGSGAAIHVPRPAYVPPALADVVERRGALAGMAEQARRLGRPRAALRAARLILRAVDTARKQGCLVRQSPIANRHRRLAHLRHPILTRPTYVERP